MTEPAPGQRRLDALAAPAIEALHVDQSLCPGAISALGVPVEDPSSSIVEQPPTLVVKQVEHAMSVLLRVELPVFAQAGHHDADPRRFDAKHPH